MNDYTYLTDPTKVSDSRWVHRAKRRWEAGDDLADQDTLEWRFFSGNGQAVSVYAKGYPHFATAAWR